MPRFSFFSVPRSCGFLGLKMQENWHGTTQHAAFPVLNEQSLASGPKGIGGGGDYWLP